jgi:hypothetical protein
VPLRPILKPPLAMKSLLEVDDASIGRGRARAWSHARPATDFVCLQRRNCGAGLVATSASHCIRAGSTSNLASVVDLMAWCCPRGRSPSTNNCGDVRHRNQRSPGLTCADQCALEWSVSGVSANPSPGRQRPCLGHPSHLLPRANNVAANAARSLAPDADAPCERKSGI